jgi:hypothetical protein
MKYDVEVTRDGRWWMIAIPAVDGLTQARRLDEVNDMARSYIAIQTDVALSTVELGNVTVCVGGEDVAKDIDELRELKRIADEAAARAAEALRGMARRLASEDVPVRDIGSVLGVSHQRVSQLVAGK